MSKKIGSIVGWIATILVAAFFLFAAVMKFMPVTPEGEAMMQTLGLNLSMEHVLGVMQIVILVLWLVPRTSTVGFVLLIGYMGGAFATNLTHGFLAGSPDMAPFYVMFALLAVSGWLRNPELVARLKGKKI